jgi:hypothetical protein
MPSARGAIFVKYDRVLDAVFVTYIDIIFVKAENYLKISVIKRLFKTLADNQIRRNFYGARTNAAASGSRGGK